MARNQFTRVMTTFFQPEDVAPASPVKMLPVQPVGTESVGTITVFQYPWTTEREPMSYQLPTAKAEGNASCVFGGAMVGAGGGSPSSTICARSPSGASARRTRLQIAKKGRGIK